MRINKGFTTAVHIILITAEYSRTCKVTSDMIAGKIGSNAVVIRTITGDLKQAGFLRICPKDGMLLAKPLREISLADVINAVEPTTMLDVRAAYKKVASRCPTGQYLNDILYDCSVLAFGASMGVFANINLAELLQRLKKKEAEYPFGNPRTLLDEDSDILKQLGI